MANRMNVTCEITLRRSIESDRGFVNGLTRRVMRKYVEATWMKTEDREHYYLLNQFDQPVTKIIQCDGEDIGRITVIYSKDRMVLDGIHIVEAFQGKGIGEHLIKRIIDKANERQLPLELILLKENPAKKLYERVGFFVYKEDVDRYYMRMAV